MELDVMPDLGLALSRGDVALWLGPEPKLPDSPNDLQIIADQDWSAIWSESSSSQLAEGIAKRWHEKSASRLLIEVPGRMNDALGEHFSLADICPFFFTRGKNEDRISERQRRLARDEMAKCLQRLGHSILIITGFGSGDPLGRLITEEISEEAPDLSTVLVLGFDGDEEQIRQQISGCSLAHRVLIYKVSLVELLRHVFERPQKLPAEPRVWVGNERPALRPLLRTEPPIDADFIILTEQDVRDRESNEDREAMLSDLVSGRQPAWRALAHNLACRRELDHFAQVTQYLKELRHGGTEIQVMCLNIPAESGSGLTVLFQQIAFEAARSGHPTLVHRSNGGRLNYELLRTFLTDLYRDLKPESQHFPAVLIFDASSVENDVRGMLQDMPSRLARDGRRVLLIRAVPVQDVKTVTQEFQAQFGIRERPGVRDVWLKGLSATISGEDQRKLAAWAASNLSQQGGISFPADLISGWDQKKESIPLLICFYFILTERLQSAADLGRHLVDGLKKALPSPSKPEVEQREDSRPSLSEIRKAVEALQQHGLGWQRSQPDQLTIDDIAAVFVSLAALGCLRIAAPRRVLADITGVSADNLDRVIVALEKTQLVTASLPLADPEWTTRNDAPHGSVAWYGSDVSIGLRHPAYGRLVLEWLAKSEATSDRQLLAAQGLTDRLLEGLDANGRVSQYPLALLEPVFSALKPSPAHVEFAAELSVRFLRLRKERRRDFQEKFVQWQWNHKDSLLEAFDWLPEQLAKQSPVILHSRGITRYKATEHNLSTSEFRNRYQEAEDDLKRALDLAEDGGREHPGNILASLGLLYLGWASREKADGNELEWRDLDRKVEDTLRLSLQTRPDNTYAFYGLARYLIRRCQDGDVKNDETKTGTDLAEALELLQAEPEAYFTDEWNELKKEAIQLLRGEIAEHVISALKAKRDELGYALEALRALGGDIPTAPTNETEEVRQLHEAATILKSAESVAPLKMCNMAQLLRYAIFSAVPERLQSPEFQRRFDLLQKLVGSFYLDRPIWRFDYGMLAFQVGQHEEGADAFAFLRKGQRYFEVPLERGQFLTKSPDSLVARPVSFRIVSAGKADEKGWGRVEHPIRFRDPVPFSRRAFESRAKKTMPGTVVTCYIRLRPSGPFAEPEPRQ